MLTPDCAQPGERQLNGKSFISGSRVSVLQTCKANFERSFAGVAYYSIGLQNCIRTEGYRGSTGEHSRRMLYQIRCSQLSSFFLTRDRVVSFVILLYISSPSK